MFKPSSTTAPIVFDADPSAYHKQGEQFNRGDKRRVMSRSQLWTFAKCPHKWFKGIPDKPTPDMDWGSLIDVLTLTPNRFEGAYAVAPEKYESEGMQCQTPGCVANGSITDAAKCGKCRQPRVKITVEKDWDWNSTTCGEWRAEREKEGKRVVKAATASDAWKAIAVLKEDEEVMQVLQASKTQVQINVEWHDEQTGLVIPIKAMLDLLPDPASEVGDTIFDLKMTADASPEPWNRRVFSDGLFYQAALYLDATNAAILGAKYRNFSHVIQESDEPYEPVVRPLAFEWLDIGRIRYKEDLARYCQCLKKGYFPGYSRDPSEPQSWMTKQI